MGEFATVLSICPQCASRSIELRERRGRYRYAQCTVCQLAFVINPLPESVLVQQYQDGRSSRVEYYRLAAPADARSFQRLLSVIERFTPPGRILDIGCNIGTFVSVARQRGWSAAGVDINEAAVKYGRSRLRLELYSLNQVASLQPATFDVLHSSDTIEHLSDPVDTLRQFLKLCRPGGIVVLSTPNYDSPFCRLLQLKPTEHIRVYNASSLAYLCRQVGVEVLTMLTFDRHRCISAMFESTTFENIRPLQRAFKVLHGLAPALTVWLPLRENIVVVGTATALKGRLKRESLISRGPGSKLPRGVGDDPEVQERWRVAERASPP